MRAAKRIILMAGFAGLAACRNNDQPNQNIVITNNVPADADVEALPPDESSTTPTDELVNGSADPVVNGVGNETEAR